MNERPHPKIRVEDHGAVRTVTLDDPARRNCPDTLDVDRVGRPRREHAATGARCRPARRRRLLLCRTRSSPVHRRGFARQTQLLGDGRSRAARAGHRGHRRLPTGFRGLARVSGHRHRGSSRPRHWRRLQLALAADLRIVADDVGLVIAEPQLGLIPDLAGTTPLVRTLGYSVALEICATGRAIGAAEAVDRGLANLAVPRRPRRHGERPRRSVAAGTGKATRPQAAPSRGRGGRAVEQLATKRPTQVSLLAAALAAGARATR